MSIKLTGAMAALAAALMVAPAALAHGNFGPGGGQGRGAMTGQGGMMGQSYGDHGMRGYGYGHGGTMGRGQGYGHGGMMDPGQAYRHGGMMGQGWGCGQRGMMGPGMMGPGMMGPGMMGPGMMGSGMMGQGQGGFTGMAAPLAEDLSLDGVRHMMEHRVTRSGNPNLKVGEIVEQDEDTITADVVTQDGSLVRRIMVDRHTGMMRPADIANMEN